MCLVSSVSLHRGMSEERNVRLFTTRHTCMQPHTNSHPFLCPPSHPPLHTHTHTHTRPEPHPHTYPHAHTYRHNNIPTATHIPPNTCTHRHTHSHTHIHMYPPLPRTHTHTHTHQACMATHREIPPLLYTPPTPTDQGCQQSVPRFLPTGPRAARQGKCPHPWRTVAAEATLGTTGHWPYDRCTEKKQSNVRQIHSLIPRNKIINQENTSMHTYKHTTTKQTKKQNNLRKSKKKCRCSLAYWI